MVKDYRVSIDNYTMNEREQIRESTHNILAGVGISPSECNCLFSGFSQDVINSFYFTDFNHFYADNMPSEKDVAAKVSEGYFLSREDWNQFVNSLSLMNMKFIQEINPNSTYNKFLLWISSLGMSFFNQDSQSYSRCSYLQDNASINQSMIDFVMDQRSILCKLNYELRDPVDIKYLLDYFQRTKDYYNQSQQYLLALLGTDQKKIEKLNKKVKDAYDAVLAKKNDLTHRPSPMKCHPTHKKERQKVIMCFGYPFIMN